MKVTTEEQQSKEEDLVVFQTAGSSYKNPRLAAVLSIIPGLGQVYNGDTHKGLLFFSVFLINLLVLSVLLCTKPVLQVFTSLVNNSRVCLDINNCLHTIQTERFATIIYLALMAGFALYAIREAYTRAFLARRGTLLPGKVPFDLPEATSSSYLLHFALLAGLVCMVLFYVTPQSQHEQATEIELISEPPPAPKPQPKPEPKVHLQKQELPKPPKPVTIPKITQPVPAKPTPVAVAVPTDTPVANSVVQSSEPAPSTSNTTDGAASSSDGAGEASGSGNDIDFGSYLAELQKRIKKAWFPPRGNESKSVTLKFKVRRDGTASSIKLVTSSGLSIVDQAATSAIKSASPFPPLPAAFPDEIDIKFTFDYNVFNGKGSSPPQ